MNKNIVFATVFLLASILLITAVVVVAAPAAYAGGDDYKDNKGVNYNGAKDESEAALADCDKNYVKHAGFKCLSIATGEVEVVEPEPEPRTCEECLEEFLTQEEIELVGDLFFSLPPGPSTAEVCGALDQFAPDTPVSGFIIFLDDIGVSEDDINNLLDCLEEAGIVFDD